jgi:hypothetical protein
VAFSSSSSSTSISAAVVSISVIGSAAMTIQDGSGSGLLNQIPDQFAEQVGISKEERRIPADHQQARYLLGLRVSRYIVVARNILRLAQYG